MTDIRFLESSPSIRAILSGNPATDNSARTLRVTKGNRAQEMRLGVETTLDIPLYYKKIKIAGNSDYSIWYETHIIPSTQLVIVEAKKKGMVSSGLAQSAIGDTGCGVGCFRTVTDGNLLDELRQYSVITYRWNAGQKELIWNTLNWMVAMAAKQSPQGSSTMEDLTEDVY
ncbi:hypothetical protein BO99DRAFT_417369 [Aspergillus violaceofuscus CBS 115571]|uniref:Uncharacterized protein n=1 Tax=Aspergillus violaceofuscus (strain CBS 115571) TaxID=1450538 RepID=A0A2V5HP61_ASPV1|nr:hypothetical protein BO99DRAFT_417369 [Aspergillus violaceofuscus CBS 115571]